MFQSKESNSNIEPASAKIAQSAATELFEDILNSGSILRVKATGKSMSPFLRGGEIVTIRQVPCSSLRKGDLIFFKNSSRCPMLHRFIRKQRSLDGGILFQTKGDALLTFDEQVPYHRVLGKVLKIDKVTSRYDSRSINMESKRWKVVNYFVAFTGPSKSKFYLGLSRFKRRLHPFLQRILRLSVFDGM